MKEFFTGGEEVRKAREVIGSYGDKPKLSKENRQRLDHARRVNRRYFFRLGAGGIVTAATVLTGVALLLEEQSEGSVDEPTLRKPSPEGSVNQSILPELPETRISISAKAPQRVEAFNDTGFDAKYLKKLLDNLKKPTSEKLDGVRKSLIENVAYVRIQELGGIGGGTALRICESGYYLSVAHLFADRQSRNFEVSNARVYVYTPTDGALASVKSVIVDGASDLAIFYAPSGKDRRKVPGLQFDDRLLMPGEKLWLLGMVFESSPSTQATLGIPYGKVDQNPKFKSFNGEETFILVDGMIPYGGSSGGPVIDSEGHIRAVESGFKLKEGMENSRRNYTHATVSPLSNLPRLRGAQINRLP